MAPTYNTTAHGLRWLPGGNLLADIDTGFQSLAEDADGMFGAAQIGKQEGVIDAGSFETTQASGGASTAVDVASHVGSGALVQDDSTARQALYYLPPTGSKTTVTITAAHATLPRVDAVVVSLAGVVSIVAGTATSGATLDNARDGSHGGAAIPASALHLADLLVPATDTTISNNQIRDRRRWARGAYSRTVRNSNAAGGNNYAVSTSTYALLDATNLAPRIECSGAPVRVRLAAGLSTSSSGTQVYFSPQVDGAGVDGMGSVGATALANGIVLAAPAASAFNWAFWEHVFIPSAGSHVIAPAVGGVAAFTLAAQAALPIRWEVEEIIRGSGSTANNSTTSG